MQGGAYAFPLEPLVTLLDQVTSENRDVSNAVADTLEELARQALPFHRAFAALREAEARADSLERGHPDAAAAVQASPVNDAATFTTIQREGIEALRLDLGQRINHEVTTAYGTDEGQHWAALCVESLPLGAFGRPGPLVTLRAGADGDAEVMGADGAAIDTVGGFAEAVQAARFVGMRTFRAMAQGAMH